MVFIISEKQGPHGSLVVVTDKNLVGKRFAEGKLQLDLSKAFYQGKESSPGEAKLLLKKAQYAHLTGKKAIALGVRLNLICKERILRVAGIPHAEMVLA